MNFKTIFLSFALLAACQPSQVAYTDWLGKWTGPEGTYLDISQDAEGYKVIISDLDGPKTFRGVGTDKGISFLREGREELIHPGTGPDTGMKWLVDKKDCLVVRTGEGFCRS